MGGSYNGRTITGIGLTKASKIEYRALTTYLTSGADFIDDFTALNQSCSDLIGTAGITASDCSQVQLALQATEMNRPLSCSDAVPPPPLCPNDTTPTNTVLSDGFETVSGGWSEASTSSTQWGYLAGQWAKTGVYSLYGDDPGSTSDHRVWRTTGLVVPTGGKLYFDSAFDFDYEPGFAYDGGVIEYSTNGGSSWLDAGSLIEAGQGYTAALVGGPLAALPVEEKYRHFLKLQRMVADAQRAAGKPAEKPWPLPAGA